MATFPQVSLACPIDWHAMRGDERERFCAQCARTVVNLSALTEERRHALLAAAKPGELCVACYRRLSGEYVSAENPLSEAERHGARQYGVASLTAAAMILSASCISPNPHAIAEIGLGVALACEEAREEAVELRDRVVARITGTPAPTPPGPSAVMVLGAMPFPSGSIVPVGTAAPSGVESALPQANEIAPESASTPNART